MSLAIEAPRITPADRLKSLKDLPLKGSVRLQTEVAVRSDPERERRKRDIALDLALAAATFYLLTSKGLQSPLQKSVHNR